MSKFSILKNEKMTDKNCAHNISLVGLSSLSNIAKQLPIPRQDKQQDRKSSPLRDSKSLENSDAELVSEITGANHRHDLSNMFAIKIGLETGFSAQTLDRLLDRAY